MTEALTVERVERLDADDRVRICEAQIRQHKPLLEARNRALAELYIAAKRDGQAVSHAELAERYGLSETTVRIAVNSYKDAVA